MWLDLVDIKEFLHKANEATLGLFKYSEGYKQDYIDNKQMSSEYKIADLEYLIGYFEEFERYEDCAILVEIKNQIKENEIQ